MPSFWRLFSSEDRSVPTSSAADISAPSSTAIGPSDPLQSYEDQEGHCIRGSCQGDFDFPECTIGYVSGLCDFDGGSGECCGHIYYSAVIYPDGDNDHRQQGGQLRLHQAPASAANKTVHSSEAWRGQMLGRMVLATNVSYREPRMVFVPDRCAYIRNAR